MNWTKDTLPSDVHANSYSHRSTKGMGVGWNPWYSFWYVAIFRNDFTFCGKPLIFSTRWGIFYGWWHCWGACEVTNNGRHLGFYQELETRCKPREEMICCAWHGKLHSGNSEKPYGEGWMPPPPPYVWGLKPCSLKRSPRCIKHLVRRPTERNLISRVAGYVMYTITD